MQDSALPVDQDSLVAADGPAVRAAVEMAEDESFPLSRPEAVERVVDILVDPPTMAAV